jgi:anti-anti-sigma factor
MDANLTIEGGIAVIQLAGRFDFSAYRDFRTAYEAALAESQLRQISVDLGRVEYLDSSALGMLLLLKDHAQARGIEIALTNCRGIVKEILDVASFGAMFPMS